MVERRAAVFISTCRQIAHMEPNATSIELIDNPGAAWEECEAALDMRALPLPLFHRSVWARAQRKSGGRCLFVPIRAKDGSCRAGFAFESFPSRALPGHQLIS